MANRIDVTLYGNRSDRTVSLPAKWEICDECRGDGTICNPNIGAITAEEWERDWGEEERAFYRSGGYDIPCHACNGTGKVQVIDASSLLRSERRWYRIWQRQEDDIQESYRMQAAERRFGA